jgi:type VI secretion system secreted protein Hcp
MALDIFLKIDDIKGESRDSKHPGEIDVLTWSWKMSQSGTTHQGTGGGAGKVKVNDLSFMKHVDKASPNLMLSCCSGKHYKEAVMTVRKAGENPLEYLKITMKEIIISSISVGGVDGDDRSVENITLNFAEFNIEYVPQKADGAGDASIQAGFNIAQNIKL